MNTSDTGEESQPTTFGFDDIDKANTIRRYNERYAEFGYSPKTLGWWGGKQDLRFDILTSQFSQENVSVLDIGCGFGDLNKTLRHKSKNYRYTGIDLNASLLAKARDLYCAPNIRFLEGEFLEFLFSEPFDYAIESGIFNHKYARRDNYDVIRDFIGKALTVCREGLAFDFNSDRRPDQKENVFYSNPARILGIALEFSKNVVLRHDYMPFEFAIFIFKDDTFVPEEKIFSRYKNATGFRWQKV